MNALMPLVVTVLDASGHPFFGAAYNGTAPDETNVVWFPEPILKPGYHWVEPSQVRGGLSLYDVGTIAELLAHALDVDPDSLDDAAVVAIVARELDRVGCDMVRCCADVASDLGDYSDTGRFARCVIRAARLLKVEA